MLQKPGFTTSFTLVNKIYTKHYILFILPLIISLFNISCTTLQSIGTSIKVIKTDRDILFDDIKYIATSVEKDEFYSLESDAYIEDFMTRFWEKRDPTPNTELNEIKVEYLRRKELADKKFKGTSKGSLTDRGRVLILYGEPYLVDTYNSEEMYLGANQIYSLEVWVYDRKAGTVEMPNIFNHIYRGREKFIFADMRGFGNYDQIYSSEKNEYIDSRVFMRREF